MNKWILGMIVVIIYCWKGGDIYETVDLYGYNSCNYYNFNLIVRACRGRMVKM
jgi:hypothetical protein